MRLTWRDLVVTLVAGAILVLYVPFAVESPLPFFAGPRVLTVAILALGVLGCMINAVGRPEGWADEEATVVKFLGATIGVGILIVALAALITGSALAVALTATGTIALWLVGTLHHLFQEPVKGGGRSGHLVH